MKKRKRRKKKKRKKKVGGGGEEGKIDGEKEKGSENEKGAMSGIRTQDFSLSRLV